ncbi:poly-gamma-glutamate hydrolase family protein [Streptomyces sp. TRM 70361]|uniref:poly-gamma-glutamate hydrolase family protein n=1 Tax=Streptomyces sp. TRM 70361 TaxID=3116553 RepID=UPI002E7C5237|nr:poly-gamma-glutamate hydrolase family protein [Streptomyces sp. TRM 70361]MEE1942162.1 poly-gamma-glutamate hydrolase family protein [Streptomyces sp. TRM 70361]
MVVGGANDGFKALLAGRLTAAGFQVVDGDDAPALAGTQPDNIANRTLPAGGGQLELTTELRNAMFGTNTRAGRKSGTTAVFWGFAGAVRQSIALLEAAQAA